MRATLREGGAADIGAHEVHQGDIVFNTSFEDCAELPFVPPGLARPRHDARTTSSIGTWPGGGPLTASLPWLR